MKIEEVRKIETPMERLVYFIQERESVRLSKASGNAAPWTDDQILQNYRFCNIRRMDDKVSDWLLRNWYEPFFDHPNILTACVLARQINRIETFEEIGFPERWNAVTLERKLQRMMDDGVKIFSGAYMITGTLGGTKVHQIIRKVLDPIHKVRKQILPMDGLRVMEEIWLNLLPYAGMGSFIAGQTVADLRWATGFAALDWADKKRWAPMGPGSQRGLNRLLLRPIRTPIRKDNWRQEFKIYIKLVSDLLPKSITSRMEAIDWQNCLCEWDKYERVLWGEGKPKQRYSGT